MGVIGMIYEARPNVTVDVASLCLKSGNAALLRGGHAAERTNAATLGVIAPVLEAHGFESALVQSVDQYGRAGATAMMEARGHIDVLVPRGGAGSDPSRRAQLQSAGHRNRCRQRAYLYRQVR